MSGPTKTALVRVLKLARTLAGEHTPDVALRALLDSALELTGAARGFVIVPDARGELVVRARRKFGTEEIPPGEKEFSRTLVASAIAEKKTISTGDVFESPASQNSNKSLRMRSLAVAPLVVGARTLGAVVIDNPRANAFSTEQIEVFEAVAALTAIVLDAVVAQRNAEDQLGRLRAILPRRKFPRLVGDSPAWNGLVAKVEVASSSDAAALVLGESGTGKELVARTIHEASRRAPGPFVAVNMSAIPEALVESELFGHAKGSFTGADRATPGLFRSADGGTIFLDEIGDASASVQVKLLRAIQERAVAPVGGGRTVGFDARIVAATNKDLRALVTLGAFREDLFYRLNVIRLEVPPLRERRGDVVLLARHFLALVADEEKSTLRRLSSEAAHELEQHAWPGNVRELENALRRAVATGHDPIRPADLELASAPRPRSRFERALEREEVLGALGRNKGNVSHAARELAVHRATLYRQLQKWGLQDSASALRKPAAGA